MHKSSPAVLKGRKTAIIMLAHLTTFSITHNANNKLCRHYVIAMNDYERNKDLRNDSTHANLMKGTASGSQS